MHGVHQACKMDVPFIGAPSACPLGDLLPTCSSSSTQTTNAQLLDFEAATWVVDIPVHDMKLVFSNALLQAKAPTFQPAF